MNSSRKIRPGNSQRGTTLIETLVALLVLSIGLLGVAALQMTSLRNNRGSHLRSQAQVMAYDITDRMRANRRNALDGLYNVALGTTPGPGTLPQTDLSRWKAALVAALPSGDGSVAIVGTVVIITVTWTDSLGTETFTTRTQI